MRITRLLMVLGATALVTAVLALIIGLAIGRVFVGPIRFNLGLK